MNVKKTVDKFLDQIQSASEKNPDIISFDIEDDICLKTIKKFKLEKILNNISPPDIQWNEYYQAAIVQALSDECKEYCKKTLFEAEIQKSVHELILAIIKQLKFKLTQVRLVKDLNLFTEWKSNIISQPVKTNKV